MGGADCVISQDQVTRYYLANHLLARKPEGQSVEEVVGAICGLHAQAPLTPYLSLWNRMRGFRAEMLDEALYQEKSLVKMWFMRGTLHVIPVKDLPVYHSALRGMWFGTNGRYLREVERPSYDERRKEVHPRILEALSNGPLRRRELRERVCSLSGESASLYKELFSPWGGVLKETCYLGLTVFAEPRDKESCFARLDRWLPQSGLKEADVKTAMESLFSRYLHCYGPASTQDFAYWSGLPASRIARVVEENPQRFAAVEVQGDRRTLWMLREDLGKVEKVNVEEKVSPRLLPRFDPYLLGHRVRTRLVDERDLKKIYRPAGDVAACVLVDGRVAGRWTWRKTKKELKVAVEPFRRFDASTLAGLEEATVDLGGFMGFARAKMLLTPS